LKRCIGLCVLLSQSVFGLEFGNPQVQSTQNAPLEVHIPVLDLGQTSASQLFPLLAPEGEFTARGMSRPESLSALTYTVASEADETRLVIRSESAWPDSELMTLVELFTPDGPRFVPVSVQIPASQSSASDEPVILNVPNGATLWRLASRVQPEGLTIEQVMMALYDTNPDAFEFDNVNALERGAQLRVPSVSVMRLESPVDAKNRFDTHMAAPTGSFPRLASRVNGSEPAPAPVTELANESSTDVTPDQSPQLQESPSLATVVEGNQSAMSMAEQSERTPVERSRSRHLQRLSTARRRVCRSQSR